MSGTSLRQIFLVRLRNDNRYLSDSVYKRVPYVNLPVRLSPTYEAAFLNQEEAEAMASANRHHGHNPFAQDSWSVYGDVLTVYGHDQDSGQEWYQETPLWFFRQWLRDVVGVEPPLESASKSEGAWYQWYLSNQSRISDENKDALWQLLVPDAYEVVTVDAPADMMLP